MLSNLYNLIALFGMQTYRYGRRFFKKLVALLKKPVFAAAALLRVAFIALDHFVFKAAHNAARDYGFLKSEATKALRTLRDTVKNAPLKAPSALMAYTKKAFQTHRSVFTYTFNTVMPVLAAIVMLITINYWANRNFALKVSRGGELIGCVKSESELKQAGNDAVRVLNTGLNSVNSDDILSDIEYSIESVRLDELSDASSIRDELIKQAESEIVSACGVYIDGSFICAVKSELSALGVFENILASYTASHENSRVAFVEDIEYIQGYYPDDGSVIWDAAALSEKLQSTKTEAVSYTVKSGDTPSRIANRFGKTLSELYSSNPWMRTGTLSIGSSVSVSAGVSYVRIKEVQTVNATVEVDYDTVETQSSSLYKGSTRTKTKGVKGEANVTRLVTYIGDTEVSSVEIARTVTKEPVSAVVEVGTRTLSRIPDNYTVTETKGRFCWPAVKAKTITSGYGYRSLGYHSAIDISGSGVSGTLVLAADSGTVTYSGWRDDGSGYCVMIDHGNGLSTMYAHMQQNSLMVRTGQKVSRGQAIGRIGNTGYSFGAHLHFEVRINGKSVNPLPYLGLG